jgi:hypothetical protein
MKGDKKLSNDALSCLLILLQIAKGKARGKECQRFYWEMSWKADGTGGMLCPLAVFSVLAFPPPPQKVGGGSSSEYA